MLHKQIRLDICQHLDRYGNEHDAILNGDETWIHRCELESKRQSTEWKHPYSPSKKKFKSQTEAYSFLGLIRPSTGTLSGEGHNNKECLLV
jgi:hypothetical protein